MEVENECIQKRENKKFADLILEMVDECGGIKNKLAQKLQIKSPRLTIWSQAKVDPAALEISIFDRIATVKGCSVEELAKTLAIKENISEKPLDRLRNLVREMLAGQSQEQLGNKLNISKNTIRGWLNPTKNIDPNLIPAGTIASLAIEKGWTIDQLLAYLNLKKNQEIEDDVIDLIESQTRQLSLSGRVKILSSLFCDFEKELSSLNPPIVPNKQETILSIKKVCVILEQENNEIASNYFSNLAEYLQFEPKNIKIATIPKLPQSLADIDILIFDINTADSPSIQLIEDLTFNGDIIIFADAIALRLIREKVSSVVSEIFVKPVDWSALQSFPYFQSK